MAMLGSVGATVALGDPSHDATAAAPAAESSKTIAVSDAMAADTTRRAAISTADTLRADQKLLDLRRDAVVEYR